MGNRRPPNCLLQKRARRCARHSRKDALLKLNLGFLVKINFVFVVEFKVCANFFNHLGRTDSQWVGALVSLVLCVFLAGLF